MVLGLVGKERPKNGGDFLFRGLFSVSKRNLFLTSSACLNAERKLSSDLSSGNSYKMNENTSGKE